MMDICYGFKGQPFKRSRTLIKIYGLVIVCLLSGATNIMALEDIKTRDVCRDVDIFIFFKQLFRCEKDKKI